MDEKLLFFVIFNNSYTFQVYLASNYKITCSKISLHAPLHLVPRLGRHAKSLGNDADCLLVT